MRQDIETAVTTEIEHLEKLKDYTDNIRETTKKAHLKWWQAYKKRRLKNKIIGIDAKIAKLKAELIATQDLFSQAAEGIPRSIVTILIEHPGEIASLTVKRNHYLSFYNYDVK